MGLKQSCLRWFFWQLTRHWKFLPIYVFAVHANMHLTLKLWMDLIQIFDEELAGCFSDILKVGWWVLLCFGRIFCHQEGDKKSYTFMTLQVSGAKVMHCGKLSNKAKVARGGEYSIILGRIFCHQQCMGDQFGWQIVYENDNHPIRPKVVMSSHYFYFPLYSLNS